MDMHRPRLTRALALASLVWVAGCADSITSPDDVLVMDDEMTLFMAEASAASATAAPAERAAAAVAHAKALLERASAFLRTQPDLSAGVQALLSDAAVACTRAEASLASGNLQLTIRAAMACGNMAREAVFLARAERLSQLHDRAASAVGEARRLVEAAAAVINSSSPEQARTVLEWARNELAQAEAALESRRFGEALGRATRASVMAERLLRVFG
jgi:hypothetical protein